MPIKQLKPRRSELSLIIVAVVIVGAAYVLASLGRTASIPANVIPFTAIVLALLVAGHIGIRILAPRADPVLFVLAAFLNGIGYVFIARLNRRQAAAQSTWTMVGIAAMILTLLLIRRVRDLERYQWTLALVGVGALMLPLAPVIGRTVNGSRLWVRLGGLSFQPGEFSKVCFAVFFAGYMINKRELLASATWRLGPLRLPDPRHLGPVVLAWGGSIIVMTGEKDLGSSLMLFTLFLVMLWLATERPMYLVSGFTLFAAAAYVAWRQFAHVQRRVTIWLHPWNDPTGASLQIVQASFAFAWGGIAGVGPGRGDPGRIPEASTDFIFAAIGEELGLVGATAILAAYVLMIGVGLRIAIRSERQFDKLLAAGLTTILGVQSFVIIGGVVRLVPLTGLTLPFLSFGGSSLIANYIVLALLLRISDEQAQREFRQLNAAAPA